MSACLPFSPAEEAEVRRQVRAACAAVVPAEHLDPIADLAVHATQEALRALERVCGGAGDSRHFIAALAPALGLVAGRCAMLQQALESYAAKQGMPQHQGAVRLGGVQ